MRGSSCVCLQKGSGYALQEEMMADIDPILWNLNVKTGGQKQSNWSFLSPQPSKLSTEMELHHGMAKPA